MKKLMSVLTVLTIVVAAVGCSGGSGDGGGASGGKMESADKSAPRAPGQPVKLEYFQIKREVVSHVNALIEEFNKLNPDIVIQQNNVPNATQVWQMRQATQDAPPIFTHYPSDAVYKKMGDEGALVDLTNEPFMKRVDPNILAANVTRNGKNHLVPVALATLGVYYNVDLFQKHNVSIPKTYDELIQAAKQFQAAGVTPFLFPDKGPGELRQEAQAKFGNYVANPNQFVTDVLNGKTKFEGNAAALQWAQDIVDLRKYGQPDTLGLERDIAVREFALGKSAMYFQGIWSIVQMKQINPSFKFDMFPFPARKAEDTRIQVSVDTAIGISKSTPYIEQAKKFVDFMTDPKNVQRYVDDTQYPSAIVGVKNNVKEIQKLADFIQADKTVPSMNNVLLPGMAKEIEPAVQALIASGDSAKFLKELDAIMFGKSGK